MSGQLPDTGTVLAIGGLDPTGGAGILADAAAIRSMGLHCAAVASLTTVQDGGRFQSAAVADPAAVAPAIRAVLAGQRCGAVKVGALGNRAVVEVVAELAAEPGFPPLVVDPVIRSTTGGTLLDQDGRDALIESLLPRTTLLTPNLDEAEELTGLEVRAEREMLLAAERLLTRGAGAVLIKGGHLVGPRVTDLLLVAGSEPIWLAGDRVEVGRVRGTGCTLASLIAAVLARGYRLPDAVRAGRVAHQAALRNARRLGAQLVVPGFGAADSDAE